MKHQEEKRNNSVSLRTDAPFKDEKPFSLRTPWIVALDVFGCVCSYWPYRWPCWRSLRRRCYPAAAATPIRFTIPLLWLLHPSKVSDISHFKSPPLENPTTRVTPSSLPVWMAGWLDGILFIIILWLVQHSLGRGFYFIPTLLSSTNGTDSLNLLLHRSRSSNRDAILFLSAFVVLPMARFLKNVLTPDKAESTSLSSSSATSIGMKSSEKCWHSKKNSGFSNFHLLNINTTFSRARGLQVVQR